MCHKSQPLWWHLLHLLLLQTYPKSSIFVLGIVMIVVVGHQGQGQQMHQEMFRQVVLRLDSLSLSDSHYWPPCQARASWLALAVQAFVEEVATVGPHVLHTQTLVGSLVKYNVASSSPTLQDSMPLPAIKKEGTPAISQISASLLSQAKLQLQKTPKPPNMISRQTVVVNSKTHVYFPITDWSYHIHNMTKKKKLHRIQSSKIAYSKSLKRVIYKNPLQRWTF